MVIKYLVNFWKNQVDFNFSNSSWNEARINWKIIRSLRTAPIHQRSRNKGFTSLASSMKNPTAKGAVNPYEKEDRLKN